MKRLALNMAAVILAPSQFSSFNLTDMNRAKMRTAWQDDPIAWAEIDSLCDLFEAELTLDPTHGADHYYNPIDAHPAWGRGNQFWTETAVIGNHVFGTCP